jgi:phenylacetate-CoA ligase
MRCDVDMHLNAALDMSAQRPANAPFWDSHAQTMSADERRRVQERRLADTVERVFRRPVDHFRRKLLEGSITMARDVDGLDALNAIPVTVKQELRDAESAWPPAGDYRFVDPREAVRVGTSTGTTGTPTLIFWTPRDLNVEYEAAARNWWRSGLRPGMIVTHAHPAYLYAGGLLLQGAYEYFGCLSVWVPPPDSDELARQGIEMWRRLRPDRPFAGYAQSRFIEVAESLGLDAERELGLRNTSRWNSGEGGSPLGTAGAECFAFLGGACSEGSGAHIAEDFAHVQALDPRTGADVPDGEWGNLVVTTFGRDSCMIRYDLEEACRIDRTPCGCGETTVRAWWGGRMHDLLAVQGRRFQVFDVEAALLSVPDVGDPSLEYVVIRPARPDDELHVRVEVGTSAGADRDAIRTKVVRAIERQLRVRVVVDVLERGSLPRHGYKAKRVVDADDHQARDGG